MSVDFNWCRWPESNRHAQKEQQILSLWCLPVPPQRRIKNEVALRSALFNHTYRLLLIPQCAYICSLFTGVAGVAGFEPTMQESKSCVLPLDDTPICNNKTHFGQLTYQLVDSQKACKIGLEPITYCLLNKICCMCL